MYLYWLLVPSFFNHSRYNPETMSAEVIKIMVSVNN